MKQGRRALQFTLHYYWTYVIQNELDAKHQKYKGRVVPRGDTVKDDAGSYAVFTEQGSSASQMTAAKIMDNISGLPVRWTNSKRSICSYRKMITNH